MAEEDRRAAFAKPYAVTDEALEAQEGDERQLSLSDLKGSRETRGFKEWQPKGRQPGEDTTGRPAPAPARRGGIGAGPSE